MDFKIVERALNDVVIIQGDRFVDERGFFEETFRSDKFHELGLPNVFVQDNLSKSHRGVVRGLHFQWDLPMAKLMRVTHGTAYLVAVDIRRNSPTFAKWHGQLFDEYDRLMVYAPAGFARGFMALSQKAEVQYKCTALYNPNGESAIRWNDPNIGIDWPLKEHIKISEKDSNAQTLPEWCDKEESLRLGLR